MSEAGNSSLDRRRFLERCAAIATCGIAGAIAGAARPSADPIVVELEAGEATIELAGQAARLLT